VTDTLEPDQTLARRGACEVQCQTTAVTDLWGRSSYGALYGAAPRRADPGRDGLGLVAQTPSGRIGGPGSEVRGGELGAGPRVVGSWRAPAVRADDAVAAGRDLGEQDHVVSEATALAAAVGTPDRLHAGLGHVGVSQVAGTREPSGSLLRLDELADLRFAAAHGNCDIEHRETLPARLGVWREQPKRRCDPGRVVGDRGVAPREVRVEVRGTKQLGVVARDRRSRSIRTAGGPRVHISPHLRERVVDQCALGPSCRHAGRHERRHDPLDEQRLAADL
jgi:hypothetical protein